jgi:ornithine cyclodeaminase/alanine dehydrogenase-like protein (mu-crystallin family)
MPNPLYLTEGDVAATFTVRDALTLVEDAARALALGEAMNRPRQRAFTKSVGINVLVAAYGGRLGHKTYTIAPKGRGARFWYTLFDDNGEMLAILEADTLGQIRTGAASGVATRFLAREDAKVLAMLGTGWQARTQLEAVGHVRPIERALVYGRDPQRRADFCEEMSEHVSFALEPVGDAGAAVAQADVVCTTTTAHEPLFDGARLKPGTHVNAAGSNHANHREIDTATVTRAAIVAVEDLAQAQMEAGDLIIPAGDGAWSWDRASLLSDVVAGKAPARTADAQITLFESLGVGLWDVAAAGFVFDRCVTEGRGTRLPFPS